MTRTKRPTAANGNGGELATYSRFRDRLLLAMGALAVTLMAYFAHQNQNQVDALTSALSKLNERLTADQNVGAGQSARFGSQNEDVLRRLGEIEKKLDLLQK